MQMHQKQKRSHSRRKKIEENETPKDKIELTKKEIHKCLRSKIAVEQAKMEIHTGEQAKRHG